MGGFSLIHWIILAVLLLLLFGGSRFSNMMGDVAKGLKSFKQGLSDEEEKAKSLPPQQPPPPQPPQPPIDVTAQPADPVVPEAPPPAKSADDKPL
ncbi:MAG: twin-arginine translocase TatA/TatE family subunit [Sphingomicrobium sp.]